MTNMPNTELERLLKNTGANLGVAELDSLIAGVLAAPGTDGGNGGPPLSKGTPGRDHWGRCFSLTLGGGGVKTGMVVGTSDKYSYSPADRPVSVPDFFATVCAALGVDASKYLYDGDRPVPITDNGNPINKLFT